MQTDLRECYRTLEVDPGANLEEVKRAYRELVMVWHPDRFAHDPKLQRKANEKLKQINFAYERICAGGSMPQVSGSSTPPSADATARGDSTSQPSRPAATPTEESKGPFILAAGIFIVGILVWINSSTNSSDQKSRGNQLVPSTPQPTYQAPLPPKAEAPKKVRQPLSVAQISKVYQEFLKLNPGAGTTLQEFSRYGQEKFPDYDFSEGINYSPPKEAPAEKREVVVAVSPPAQEPEAEKLAVAPAELKPAIVPDEVGVRKEDAIKPSDAKSHTHAPLPANEMPRDFFTVGSSREEVLAVQGTPDGFSDTTLDYPYGSKVFFKNGRVRSWTMSPTNPLKVRLLPAAAVQNRGFFTLASTKDEVLVVQGTPDEFTDTVFSYPYGSKVVFRNGLVTSWEMSPTNPLKVKLLPSSTVKNRGFFTVGSTKDEVLTVQGTPDEFSDAVFNYPYGSKVIFRNGRVTAWQMSPTNPLKVKLLPSSTVENRGFFTVGSTKDEVLTVQGTPDEFSDTVFSYPYGSRVFFQNDRVTSWQSSPVYALKVKLEK